MVTADMITWLITNKAPMEMLTAAINDFRGQEAAPKQEAAAAPKQEAAAAPKQEAAAAPKQEAAAAPTQAAPADNVTAALDKLGARLEQLEGVLTKQLMLANLGGVDATPEAPQDVASKAIASLLHSDNIR